MNDNAVSIDRITKVYKLYHHPLDRMKEALDPRRKKYHQDFYALREVSFDVPRGETVGVIGKNGSGKSTLLKIITGILTPTGGTMTVKGKVSALLELGAGFNPELTGIENVYFSGTIMGYTRAEMDERLETIRAFADISDYMDQPVKTYSSGMFVRLAFAVAVNVDPDILIVDEAMAVGDISFQAKCFRKFNEFKQRGKTIIFVTHALDSIIRYCDRALVLENGKKITESTPKEAVDVYKKLVAECYDPSPTPIANQPDKAPASTALKDQFVVDPNALSYGDHRAEIVDFGLFDEAERPVQLLHNDQPFVIRMKVLFHADLDHPIFAYTIKDLKGLELTGTNTFFQNISTGGYRKGECAGVEFRQTLNAQSGRYGLSLGCVGFEREKLAVYHRLYDVLLFEVVSQVQMVGFYDLHSAVTIKKELPLRREEDGQG
ncbi:MAG: ABC transporter ATP-binding protein [Verrucomicrobia bacterium]|nr:ABC transporter ATP-binding protein [Verrucomicrobiota bacterium]MBU4292404.1 ABC transporter ATP-binding protein [Verrucomicrobiota bacterium]MBU4429776.1 ABC transporter ATP-binding protein [Verrucomicrobiota bacterium]MBU4497347.1 ABC transporter ATP-binding protein [Verrucomicrobiota bacterium]MCG2679827.1 ABC transporter ATP-binding protein [Kiritimatiellia bacterium]